MKELLFPKSKNDTLIVNLLLKFGRISHNFSFEFIDYEFKPKFSKFEINNTLE